DGTEPSLPLTPEVTIELTPTSAKLNFSSLTDPAGGTLSDIELTVFERNSRTEVFGPQRIGAVSSYTLPDGTLETGRPWYNPAKYICRFSAAYNRSGEEVWSRPNGSGGFEATTDDSPPDGNFSLVVDQEA